MFEGPYDDGLEGAGHGPDAHVHAMDPDYVASLSAAVSRLFWLLVVHAAFGLIYGLTVGVIVGVSGATSPPPPVALMTGLTIGGLAVGLVLAFLILGAWWKTTQEEPGALEPGADAPNARAISRLMLLLTIVVQIGSGVYTLSNPAAAFSNSIDPAGIGIACGTGLVWAGTMTAMCFYLRHLGRRIGTSRLRTWGDMMVWLAPLLATVGAFVCIGPLAAQVLLIIQVGLTRSDLAALRADA